MCAETPSRQSSLRGVQGLQAFRQALDGRGRIDSMRVKERLADISTLVSQLHASVGVSG